MHKMFALQNEDVCGWLDGKKLVSQKKFARRAWRKK